MVCLTPPHEIIDKVEELGEIVHENPVYIPLKTCAEFLGVADEGLRRSIEQGKCPFGIAWQQTGAANRGFKIPTVPFYLWYTQGVGCKSI